MTQHISRRRGRVAAALAGVAISALVLTGCSGGDDAGSAGSTDSASDGFGDLSLQLSWILNEEFAGEFLADSRGYYTDAGFASVNLIPGPSTGIAELTSGTADIAVNDAISTGAAVANEGAPLKIIGSTFQANPFTILSLADGGDIATPEDLVGKRIGVQDSNLALFNAFLSANEIPAADVEVVPVQYDPSPVVTGEVDGFMAYLVNESITVDLMGLETTNLPFAENGMPFVAETFTVTDDFLEDNRELLKAFLVAEIRGWTDALAEPEEGARLALEEYGVDLDLDPEKTNIAMLATLELVTSEETVANGLFTVSDTLQEQTVASLARAGIELEAADLFDLSLLDEVYAENPELIDYAS